MVNVSASSVIGLALVALRDWLRAGGSLLLVAAAGLAVGLWGWPLDLGASQRGGALNPVGEYAAVGDGGSAAWRDRALRAPLGAGGHVDAGPEAPPTESWADYQDDTGQSQVALVGLSYRRHGRSLGFFRIDGGEVQVLGAGDEIDGLVVEQITEDRAVVRRGEQSQEVMLAAAGAGTGGGYFDDGYGDDGGFDAGAAADSAGSGPLYGEQGP